ncbi:hypothetical protein K461DRAFT_273967 [Myriangium duriaei CBS 260.36]|uniref:SGNH hydrolase-type esterase domain-containing protein n=1 Tax=Myriangium duriaei CBS 260.36 TaxID=1168546 RepID=A0A9P4JCT4_9PEZI|nr:hypothetical protein K461DRAFT_273967 [Myriangium duriaei CBS 260.36]
MTPLKEICLALLLCLQLTSAGPVKATQKTISYPFNQIIGFGDELSDNGSGSHAHGIAGNPESIYGNNTWTNGPVAITYLAKSLNVPLRDFAFGGCCGGASFGATIDNAFTKSPANAQSLVDQIKNYTSHPHPNIKKALQFVWVGQNDIPMHTDAYWLTDPKNAAFAADASTRLAASVKTLLDAGAPYVFLANIFPRQLAPVTSTYLCGTNVQCAPTFGQIIQQANAAIQQSMKQFGKKVIYFDAYSSVNKILNNANSLGFTRPLSHICDGQGDANWNDCMVNGNADKYFWMTFYQPTTRAHAMIAADMKAAIDAHFQ